MRPAKFNLESTRSFKSRAAATDPCSDVAINVTYSSLEDFAAAVRYPSRKHFIPQRHDVAIHAAHSTIFCDAVRLLCSMNPDLSSSKPLSKTHSKSTRMSASIDMATEALITVALTAALWPIVFGAHRPAEADLDDAMPAIFGEFLQSRYRMVVLKDLPDLRARRPLLSASAHMGKPAEPPARPESAPGGKGKGKGDKVPAYLQQPFQKQITRVQAINELLEDSTMVRVLRGTSSNDIVYDPKFSAQSHAHNLGAVRRFGDLVGRLPPTRPARVRLHRAPSHPTGGRRRRQTTRSRGPAPRRAASPSSGRSRASRTSTASSSRISP